MTKFSALVRAGLIASALVGAALTSSVWPPTTLADMYKEARRVLHERTCVEPGTSNVVPLRR